MAQADNGKTKGETAYNDPAPLTMNQTEKGSLGTRLARV